jgi:hypothetical protein
MMKKAAPVNYTMVKAPGNYTEKKDQRVQETTNEHGLKVKRYR